MSNNTIKVFVYSYKNKNLKKVVDSVLKNTVNNVYMTVMDQHPLKREDLFADAPNVQYRHIFWDYQTSPILHKAEEVYTDGDMFVAFISDDTILSPGWDQKLIDFIDDRKIIVSGRGKTKVLHKDKFFLEKSVEEFDDFHLSQYIDRNLVFGKKSILSQASWPSNLKYFGEEEFLSLEFFCRGIDIYSAPYETYEDLLVRTLESIYVAFSTVHNYNSVVKTLKDVDDKNYGTFERNVSDFLAFHKLSRDKIRELFYENNDVSYNPEEMEIQDFAGERFIATTKAIY